MNQVERYLNSPWQPVAERLFSARGDIGHRHYAAGAVSAFDGQPPQAILHVGNSLTDQAYGMRDIAKARGHETKLGRHMIPGTPLQWLWEHREVGFRALDGKKPADDILKDHN